MYPAHNLRAMCSGFDRGNDLNTMKPLFLALGAFVGVTVGAVAIVISLWFGFSYFSGGESTEGAFWQSMLLGFVFVPLILACPVVGFLAGKTVYRRHSTAIDALLWTKRKRQVETVAKNAVCTGAGRRRMQDAETEDAECGASQQTAA